MTDALRLAFGTLTAVRVSPPTRVDAPVARAAMLVAPVAALPFAGAVVLGFLGVAGLGLGPLLAAALLLGVLALGTRGLHVDGLADTADGLASGYDPERALMVMRRGDVGPAGVATVALVLLAQAAALATLVATLAGTVLAATAVVASRHTLAWLCRPAFAPARSDGLGAAVCGTVPTAAATGAGLVLACLAASAGWLAGARWYAGPLVVAAAVIAALVTARRARTRLGGITGDVLGAGVELGFAAAVAVASVLL